MFKKNNKNVIDKIINEEEIKLYKDERELYKDKYKKILKGDINALKLEKERIKHSIKISELPHASMYFSYIAALVVLLVQFSYSYVADIGNSIIAYITSICMIVYIIHNIYKAIFPINNEAKKYHLCLQVLDELENEISENGELKNYSSEVLEEVAVTQVEANSETSDMNYKTKGNNSIKGLFKKKRLKKEMERQNKLKDDFSKLKLLDKEALIIKKYHYIKEAKIQRDNASVVKEWMKIATILISILGITGTITIEGYKEMILRYTLGSILLIIIISIFISGHNDKTSEYETLVKYIDEQLIKDKI